MIGKKSLKEIRAEVTKQLTDAGVNTAELVLTLRSLHRKPSHDKTAERELTNLAKPRKRQATAGKK